MFYETQNYGMPKKQLSTLKCYQHWQCQIVWNKYTWQYHISLFLTGSNASVGKMQKLQSENILFYVTCWPSYAATTLKMKYEICHWTNGSWDFHNFSLLQQTNTTTYHKNSKHCQHVTYKSRLPSANLWTHNTVQMMKGRKRGAGTSEGHLHLQQNCWAKET